MMTNLPSGRLGQAIALTATLSIVLVIWFAAVLPLHDWYFDGSALLTSRQMLAARMASLVEQTPALTRQAGALGAGSDRSTTLLTGDTDAIAGARLQEIVQTLAGAVGIAPTSIENLPAVPAGRYRRIALHVSLTGRFLLLVQLLQTIGEASPHVLIDDLHIEGPHLINQPVDSPLEAQLTVIAFRSAEATGAGPAAVPQR